jgi:hypothetical protein
MSSVESLAFWFARRFCNRDCGALGTGDWRELVVWRGDERKRGIANGDEAAAFCLRLKEILCACVSVREPTPGYQKRILFRQTTL